MAVQEIHKNDRFTHWVVLEQAPNVVSSGVSRKAYKCQCDCGTIRVVTGTRLRLGKSTSCGCRGVFLKSGERYQEWTVIKKSEKTNNHHSQFYLCQCSCGVIREVRMSDLLNGKSRNCGHSRQVLSRGALSVKNFLVNNNINFYQEYIFPDLPNRRYDFAIFNEQDPQVIIRLIEFDGEQHCKNSKSNWHTEDLVRSDQEKNNYALTHNIPLIRIPYYKTVITYQDIFEDTFLVKKEE